VSTVTDGRGHVLETIIAETDTVTGTKTETHTVVGGNTTVTVSSEDGASLTETVRDAQGNVIESE